MRIVPILTAILVSAAIYLFIMERQALLAFAGADGTKTEPETAISAVAEKPPVSVVALKSRERSVKSGIVLRGRTEAFRYVDVKSEVTGQVISQPLRKGTLIEKGELLCALDAGTKAAALAEAKARLAEADANNKVSASLVQKGFASETTAIARIAALEAAQASVIRAEKEISRLRIMAPFSGLLETDAAEFGSLLQPGVLCATVIALDPIKLVGFATEQQISQLTIGTRAGARLVSGREIVGKLTFLSRRADPQTRTFRVEVTVPNPDLSTRDGSTADILIALQGQVGHLLPQSSLTLDNAGRLGVRIVKKNIADFIPVAIIRDTAEGVWVSGLPTEVDVIVVGQEFVTSGRKVVVTYRKDAS
jgi:membrane fusion protein, multidrug efflux system